MGTAGGQWSVVSGQPHIWLVNASGLVWLDNQRLLFSEVKNKDIHMGIVTAEENRAGERDVYVPASERGMAHRTYPAPDGKSALIVEMERGGWLPCRLVPIDAASAGRPVGPPNAACTFAAWSPDGKWMYFSSNVGGTFHTWRQRYPEGQPEQFTAGLTEEEGIAMTPDGRSFITSVASRQSVVWLHDARGERQISLEGYSFDPKFTPDGKGLCYRILRGALPAFDPSELHIVELDTGHNERLLPGLTISGRPGSAYSISPDGREVVAAAKDAEGRSRLWVAALDGQSPARRIPNVQGDMPQFGKDGEIFFRAIEGSGTKVYGVHEDGTNLRMLSDRPLGGVYGISQDRQWLVIRFSPDDELVGVPIAGGSPVPAGRGTLLQWSPDGRLLFRSVPIGPNPSNILGRTYVMPLAEGQIFGKPAESVADLAKLPGVRIMDAYDFSPGPTPEIYAFSRQTVQRNLYRVAIP